MKYQKTYSGGLKNVTDSGGENDLEVNINVPKRERESKSGELIQI